MSLTLKTCCAVCSSTEKLARCQACGVMPYCGREHQVAHRNEHKKACNAVKKAKSRVDAEEQRLRSLPPDMFTPPNLFEEHVGHFWGILETRDYMRARFGYVNALKQIKTAPSVQIAFDEVWDMLRLCRSDNMGMRDLIPGLFLRLGKNQECYDFIKWHAQDHYDYDWGDMSLPFLDIKDADIFEPVTLFVKKWSDTCHTVAITLIKIRLFLELKNIEDSEVVGKKSLTSGKQIPREILDNVQNQLLGETITRNPLSKDLMTKKDVLEETVNDLRMQIIQLYEAVSNANPHFWPALVEPGRHLTARMEAYSRGSVQEMQLFLQYSYDSWAETPGAIDIIEQLKNNEFLGPGDFIYERAGESTAAAS